MTAKTRWIVVTVAVVGIALAVWTSQNVVVRNLMFLIEYERTLDAYSQADTTVTQVSARKDAEGREARLLSAFFGLDNGLPFLFSLASCRGADGMDGMPIIFSHEVDPKTLEPGDLRIVRRSGALGRVVCLTMAPSDDPGELRTALIIGELGSAVDQPITVEIVGNVLSRDGSLNFRGASIPVTPLESGPRMVMAAQVPEGEWTLGKVATRLPWGGGSGCPIGTRQIIRVTWDGGVKKPDGSEADSSVRDSYEVTVTSSTGQSRTVSPFALADIGDGDNNHLLCLDVTDTPSAVRLPGGLLIDPRNDLSLDSRIPVSRYIH